MISPLYREQIKLMSETGISNRMISRRLEKFGVSISEAHISRILKQMRVKRGVPMLDRLLGTDLEYELWQVYYDSYGSFRSVADRFGMSHEAVRIKLLGR